MIRASDIEQKQKEIYEKEKDQIVGRIIDEFDRELLSNYDPTETKICIRWPKWLTHSHSRAMEAALDLYAKNGWKTGMTRGYDPRSQEQVMFIEFTNLRRQDPRFNPLPVDPPAPNSPSG